MIAKRLGQWLASFLSEGRIPEDGSHGAGEDARPASPERLEAFPLEPGQVSEALAEIRAAYRTTPGGPERVKAFEKGLSLAFQLSPAEAQMFRLWSECSYSDSCDPSELAKAHLVADIYADLMYRTMDPVFELSPMGTAVATAIEASRIEERRERRRSGHLRRYRSRS